MATTLAQQTMEKTRDHGGNRASWTMHVQIVMDHTGDTRHEFDVADTEAVAQAEERFRELTSKGFRAVAMGKNGDKGRLLGKFDPQVEQTLFIPQLQGG